MKRPLTAQEAFEQFGFIPITSTGRLPLGPHATTIGTEISPAGTQVVITGEITRAQYDDFCANCGWDGYPYRFFYKAIAE